MHSQSSLPNIWLTSDTHNYIPRYNTFFPPRDIGAWNEPKKYPTSHNHSRCRIKSRRRHPHSKAYIRWRGSSHTFWNSVNQHPRALLIPCKLTKYLTCTNPCSPTKNQTRSYQFKRLHWLLFLKPNQFVLSSAQLHRRYADSNWNLNNVKTFRLPY